MSNMLDSLFICIVYRSHIYTVRSEFLWQNVLIHVSKNVFKYIYIWENMSLKVHFSVIFISFASSNNSVKCSLVFWMKFHLLKPGLLPVHLGLYYKALVDISIFIFLLVQHSCLILVTVIYISWAGRGQSLLLSVYFQQRLHELRIGGSGGWRLLQAMRWLVQGPAHDPVRTNRLNLFFF